MSGRATQVCLNIWQCIICINESNISKAPVCPNEAQDTGIKTLHLMCTWLARICWGRLTSCFVYGFLFQVINEKTVCLFRCRFCKEFERHFCIKIIVTIILTNSVANSLLFPFWPFIETKNKVFRG